MKVKQSKIYAVLGTLLFAVLLLLLLFFVVMPLPEPLKRDEMGLMVSFGNNAEDYGWEEKVEEVEEKPVSKVEEVAEPEDAVEEKEIITQEKSPVIIPKKKEKKKKKKTPIVKKEKKKLQKKEATNQKTQEETDNFMKNVFQRNGGGGKAKGTEKRGNPAGKGNSNGHAWSLLGRGLIGSIVSPNYTSNVEGKITVAIRVDKVGNVTNASISSPTTISDKATRDAAIKAARKTHFSAGKGISIGTITYNFRLQ